MCNTDLFWPRHQTTCASLVLSCLDSIGWFCVFFGQKRHHHQNRLFHLHIHIITQIVVVPLVDDIQWGREEEEGYSSVFRRPWVYLSWGMNGNPSFPLIVVCSSFNTIMNETSVMMTIIAVCDLMISCYFALTSKSDVDVLPRLLYASLPLSFPSLLLCSPRLPCVPGKRRMELGNIIIDMHYQCLSHTFSRLNLIICVFFFHLIPWRENAILDRETLTRLLPSFESLPARFIDSLVFLVFFSIISFPVNSRHQQHLLLQRFSFLDRISIDGTFIIISSSRRKTYILSSANVFPRYPSSSD